MANICVIFVCVFFTALQSDTIQEASLFCQVTVCLPRSVSLTGSLHTARVGVQKIIMTCLRTCFFFFFWGGRVFTVPWTPSRVPRLQGVTAQRKMWPFLLHAVIKWWSVTRCEQSGFCSRTQLLFGCCFFFFFVAGMLTEATKVNASMPRGHCLGALEMLQGWISQRVKTSLISSWEELLVGLAIRFLYLLGLVLS